jgi:hypothetical protein
MRNHRLERPSAQTRRRDMRCTGATLGITRRPVRAGPGWRAFGGCRFTAFALCAT